MSTHYEQDGIWNFNMDSQPMSLSLQDFAELATLDAYGLLEAADQLRFEQAFLSATPEVQAEIRRIQSEIALDDRLLPNITPPASLKQRVLDRVRAAHDLGHAATPFTQSSIPAPIQMGMGHRFMQSVWTWRMAALVLFAVCVTLIVNITTLERSNTELQATARNVLLFHTMESEIGSTYDDYLQSFGQNYRKVHLAGNGVSMRVAINEQTGDVFCLAQDVIGLDGPCHIRILNDDGTELAAGSLSTDTFISGLAMKVGTPKQLQSARIIMTDQTGQLILSGTLA